MHPIITCPSCQRKVQLPEEYLGRPVQCPECGRTFLAGEAATSVTASAETPRPMPSEMDEPAPRRRPRYPVDDDDAFDDWGVRKPSLHRNDRSGMILAFGILGLMAPCYLGLIFGPLSWFMGTADL